MESNHISLFFSCHRALLGNITPNVRAVYIMSNEINDVITGIVLHVIFASPPEENEKEIFRIVTSEIVSDFDSIINCTEDFHVIEPPSSYAIRPGETLMYLRYEKP